MPYGPGIALGINFPFASVLGNNAGFDFYLDSAASPGGDGLTPATAFNTPGDITWEDGLRLGVAAGSSFRAEISDTHNNTHVGRYGSGANPIFNASDIVSPASWVKTPSYTNIYQITLVLPASGNGFVNAWVDGAFLNREVFKTDLATTLTNLDGNPGTFYVTADTGTVTFYYHATGSTDPITDGKTVEVVARDFGVALRGSNCSIIGVLGKNQYHNDGSVVVGSYGQIINSTAQNGHKHCMYAGQGSLISGCAINEAKYNGFGNLLVIFEGTADGSGTTIVNTTITLTEAQHSGGSQTAVYHHANSGAFGTLTAENVTIDGGGIMAAGLSGDNGSLLNVTGGLIKNCVSGISYSSDVVIDGGQVLTDMAISGGVIGVNAVASTTVTIQNGTKICMSGLNASTTCLRYNGNGAKFVANGNFFKVNETADYQGYIITTPGDYTGMELTFDNNQIGSGDFLIAGVISIGWGANPVTVNSFDGNHYEANAAREWGLNGTTSANFTAWKARGYDSTGAVDGDASAACVV